MINHRLYELNRPVVFAHRGASKYAPENTLASFRKAMDMGAQALELDVTLSRDGTVVVIHDDTVDRISNGNGEVGDLTLAQIQALDAGSWFSVELTGERIPTLEEVFDLVGKQALINIELKNAKKRNTELVQKVAALVKAHNVQETVIFSSFIPKNVRLTRALLPECPVGLLTLPGFLGKLEMVLFPNNSPDLIHPHHSNVSAAFIEKQHARMRRVNTYTVNDADLMRTLIGWDVDGFFCDDLITAQQVLTKNP
ncbi:MAG TPA: glycerophosphodiester phosphodiesterase [Anaerolineaceae bacterium]|uniref:Putative glycerophosphoryl diester phosphodiesterase n=1 Tax=Anaerolinea thermophila TaxID=167964 RepID=A0A101FZ05_9CHLR|nr:MAG: Putative glycerophosphoryl diester phosphodiesterase [Anaerolinea thermophila]HAF62801.1 glycerophosphodiester phosphodiesterase [Anaerolineaceae bacterium]